MKKNMGAADRIVRGLAAIAFILLYATGTVDGLWGALLAGLGAVFILTSVVGSCPLYPPLGLNTRKEVSSTKQNN